MPNLMTEHIQTSGLRDCFRKLGERMVQGKAAEAWEDSVTDLLDDGRRSIRISSTLVDGEVIISFEASDELLRHL